MEKFDSQTPSRLREAREAAGLTLDQVSREIGYSKGSLSNIETGRDRPGRRLFEKLIAYYGIRREWVESGLGEMFTQQHILIQESVDTGVEGLPDVRFASVNYGETNRIFASHLGRKLRDMKAMVDDFSKELDQIADQVEAFESQLARKSQKRQASQ